MVTYNETETSASSSPVRHVLSLKNTMVILTMTFFWKRTARLDIIKPCQIRSISNEHDGDINYVFILETDGEVRTFISSPISLNRYVRQKNPFRLTPQKLDFW